jgi:hypothetical protein
MTDIFNPYTVGLCYASVCSSLSPEETIERLNLEHPTGIAPWTLAEEPFRTGEPNPCPCPDHSNAKHYLLVC